MTTAPRSSTPGTRPGGVGAVLRPALVVTAVIGVGGAVLGAVLDGRDAALGAALGALVVALFFGLGAFVLDVVSRLAPAASLLIALLTYVLKVVLLAVVFVGLQRSGAFDGDLDARWLGGTMIVATFAWTLAQLMVTLRARVPVYDVDLPDLPDSAPPSPAPRRGSSRGPGGVSQPKEAGAP
jgi:ATP synthase protein I